MFLLQKLLGMETEKCYQLRYGFDVNFTFFRMKFRMLELWPFDIS
jgi:hypothetical protein